jgi:endonuclease/exonuclease/phosphatase family metal-dependent hydrolase
LQSYALSIKDNNQSIPKENIFMNKAIIILVCFSSFISSNALASSNASNNKNSREVASALDGIKNKTFAKNDSPELIVASFNIAAGKVTSPQNIAKAISAINADVISLQEVDKLTNRSGNIDQLKEIEKITGMNGIYCRAIDFDDGQYGLAILSKYPIKKETILELPSGNREQRIGCVAKVNVPNFSAPITFINTHLDTKEDPSIRLQQIRELNDRTIEMRGIKFLMGDMNDTYTTNSIKELTKYWNPVTPFNKNYRTWPSINPEIGVDYIFTSNAQRWDIKSLTIPEGMEKWNNIQWGDYSDHLPIIAKLALIEQ